MIKLLKIGSMVVAGVAIMVVLLTTFYAAEIKQLIVRELNKSLKSPVQVKDIQFSVLRHFPFASVELSNVMAMDAMPQPQRDTLLTAEHISLLFNVTGIFSNNINIKKVVMKNGSLAIRVDKDGKDSYHIWQSADSNSQSIINLQKIILDRVTLTYEDAFSQQSYNWYVDKAALKGRFASASFMLDADANLTINRLVINQVNYLAGKEAVLKTNLQVDQANGIYRFDGSRLQVADVLLDINGMVKNHSSQKGFYTDISIQTNKAQLDQLITLLPQKYAGYIQRYHCDGLFALSMSIKGESERGITTVSNFEVENGELTPADKSTALKQIKLKGTFKNIPGKSEEIDIPSVTANLQGQQITGSIRMVDFQKPYLNIYAKANLSLDAVRNFIQADTLEVLTGNLNLDMQFAGSVQDFSSLAGKPQNIKASGNLQLTNTEVKLKNYPLWLKQVNGIFHLRDNNLDIVSLAGHVSSTDFLMSGTFTNFINYMFAHGHDGVLSGNISSNHLNLDELMVNKSATATSDTSYLMKFNPRLVCNMNVSVQEMQFRVFKASDIHGTVQLKNQVISSDRLSFASMNGHTVMSASIDASRKNKITTVCQATISGIDIKELFYELENFDQHTLTDKNLKGRLSADVDFTADWTTALDIVSSTARAQCDITIENGELNNFAPVQALSKYLKVADLNNIRFSTLKNKVNISDRRIFIPAMEIKSSALNLTVSGTHDFDNMVDYKLNMLMSDVLSKKVNERNTEFGEIEEDAAGKSRLFLTMKGPVDNPKFSYDRKGVGDKIKQDLQAEKQSVKKMLKEELGLLKKDATLKTQTNNTEVKKKKEELQVDWDNNE